jgi:subtilisin-like proprotein convertase family protein
MKTLTFLIALLLLPTATQAAVSQTFVMSSPASIPDGDLSGLVQSITPSTTIGTLNSITVSLQTTDGWNGDLYAYLWHGGEISVLLNRISRSTTNLAGSHTSGLDITFDMTALTDVHGAPGTFGSIISGTYQPDGRNIHPNDVLDTTPRTAGLDVFTGDEASGEYRLFIADVATGDTATLVSWSITLTGEAIPEPSSAILLLASSLVCALHRRR